MRGEPIKKLIIEAKYAGNASFVFYEHDSRLSGFNSDCSNNHVSITRGSIHKDEMDSDKIVGNEAIDWQDAHEKYPEIFK